MPYCISYSRTHFIGTYIEARYTCSRPYCRNKILIFLPNLWLKAL